jgi:biopolymer transport protein ExbB
MKKLFALIAVFGLLSLYTPASSLALPQDDGAEMVDDATGAEDAPIDSAAVEEVVEDIPVETVTDAVDSMEETTAETEPQVESLNMYIKRYFIEGNPFFMSLVLICLILGLALCIERIVYLNMSSSNTKELLKNIDNALNSGGVEAAKEVCRNTRGPVASIFFQGLDRSSGSIEDVEKSIENYGGVQMGLLERGLSWISLFIAIAPMLGFMGTVIGMILAFDKIQSAGTMDATIVAGGIKVALITTVSGLVVAIILQIFYNYILSKIDGLILEMEEASIDLVDMLYARKVSSNG